MPDHPTTSAPGGGLAPAGSRPAHRPRNLRRKRETEEEDGERAAAGPAHAPPSTAALEDLKFLQKQRGRRTVR